jgi:hypothetical protein
MHACIRAERRSAGAACAPAGRQSSGGGPALPRRSIQDWQKLWNLAPQLALQALCSTHVDTNYNHRPLQKSANPLCMRRSPRLKPPCFPPVDQRRCSCMPPSSAPQSVAGPLLVREQANPPRPAVCYVPTFNTQTAQLYPLSHKPRQVRTVAGRTAAGGLKAQVAATASVAPTPRAL